MHPADMFATWLRPVCVCLFMSVYVRTHKLTYTDTCTHTYTCTQTHICIEVNADLQFMCVTVTCNFRTLEKTGTSW
jgi:hypothetical protein